MKRMLTSNNRRRTAIAPKTWWGLPQRESGRMGKEETKRRSKNKGNDKRLTVDTACSAKKSYQSRSMDGGFHLKDRSLSLLCALLIGQFTGFVNPSRAISMLFRVLYIRNQDAALQAQLIGLSLASGSEQCIPNTSSHVGVKQDQAIFRFLGN
ncbi:uncharacterized protein BDW47DRAFT_82307 [Aspergillus candidus]|uniref:Uncharacterized protein n=1 Tax=Aspergillus candidus TaxID=41067 RepID=A0A2I2FJG8_ASPCN|nr:hypothetical protein BDW47DRAFT_82307 [Aspergillus candidus]PLB40787.1 hypothetical protein BDW47DRAFT_82307 [Aspergillus candidus]